MRAAVITDDHFTVETVADPVPGPNDLVLRVTGCGVCGSDLKARHAMPTGTVMGHELCGEVVAVGSAATDRWKPGQHAAVLPVISCGKCPACRSGRVAHCEQAALIGLGGAPGGFAEYVRVSAQLSFLLPDDLSPLAGVLVEPFAVGLHTARAARIGGGDSVLVIGGGSVGLTTARWARELGASTVTVSDPVPARRAAAAEAFGATATIDPATEELGGPYDVVVECVGAPGLLDVCAGAAANHGRVVIAGVCAEPDPFLQLIPLLKELTISFSVYYSPDEFRTVIDAFRSGRIEPLSLVSRSVGLDAVNELFESLDHGTQELKIIVDPAAGDRTEAD